MAAPSSRVRLIGLDFGSTTTSGIVARATLHGGADRRSELTDVKLEHRSEPIFTPFCGRQIDERALANWLDDWSRTAGVTGADIAGGGAIVTGLAAKADNASIVRQLVRERFGETLIATADDPALESWLAFMANCRDLSLAAPEFAFLNLDIGGGTTNVALGHAGQVLAVDCFDIGARHIRFIPGSYQIAGCSEVGKRLLADLSLSDNGEPDSASVTKLVGHLVEALEAIVEGRSDFGFSPGALGNSQFQSKIQNPKSKIVLSGGVGELAYRMALGDQLPGTTAFGDLGIDLARGIVESPILSKDLRSHTPAALGRATVFGLAIHHVQLSGATLFLPDRAVLPLAELPIVGRLRPDSGDDQIAAALDLVRHSVAGGCIAIELPDAKYATVRALGSRLAAAIEASSLPAERPLVLLVNQNVGKTLGQYATRWRKLPVTLIVLDELPDRGAAFATLGRPHDQVVPVSFYGL
jgi:ethanolamine utilization protein EutA